MSTLKEIGLVNVRTFESLQLRLAPVNLLIGENGCGKSTIIESLELLRRASTSNFLEELHTVHGGPAALLRVGKPSFDIRAGIVVGDVEFSYVLRIGKLGEILHERLSRVSAHEQPTGVLYQRSPAHDVLVLNEVEGKMEPHRCRPEITFISQFRGRDESGDTLGAVADALAGIDVQIAFDVGARWVANSTNRSAFARDAVKLAPTRRLQRLAANLPNAYLQLRNAGDAAWGYTMELVRLGLGEWIEAVQVEGLPSGGMLALSLKPRGQDVSLPADALSDGMLGYLALIALVRLPSDRSLLVFDEPELHLHPSLAARALGLLASTADEAPVLVATHSSSMLDALENPASSVCLLDVTREFPRTTSVSRPNAAELSRWLADYDGLGSVIAAGFGRAVVDQTAESSGASAARDSDPEG